VHLVDLCSCSRMHLSSADTECGVVALSTSSSSLCCYFPFGMTITTAIGRSAMSGTVRMPSLQSPNSYSRISHDDSPLLSDPLSSPSHRTATINRSTAQSCDAIRQCQLRDALRCPAGTLLRAQKQDPRRRTHSDERSLGLQAERGGQGIKCFEGIASIQDPLLAATVTAWDLHGVGGCEDHGRV